MKENKGIDDPSLLNTKKRLGFIAKDAAIYGGASAFNAAFGIITFPIVSLLLPCLFIFGGSLISLPDPLSETSTILKISLFQVPFYLILNFSNNLLKWTFNRTKFLIVSIGSTVFTVIVLWVTIVWIKPTIIEVFYIYLITRGTFSLLGLWFCRSWLIWPKQWIYTKQLLKFAAPYGIICVAGACMPALERTFIVKYLNEDSLGLFAAGSKIALLISLPIQAFQMAWGPFSLSIFKQEDSIHTYNLILKIFTFSIFVLALMLSIVAEPLVQLLASHKYAGASVVVLPITMGLSVRAIGVITHIGIGLSKKSYLSLYVYAIYTLVSVIAIYCLLNLLGLAGVAWGSMIGLVAMAISNAWFGQRAYPMAWNYSGVKQFVLISVFVGLVNQYLILHFSAVLSFSIVTLMLVTLVVVGWHVLFSFDERKSALSFIKRLPNKK